MDIRKIILSRLNILLLAILVILHSCKTHQDQPRKYFNYNQIGGLETLDPAFAKNLSIIWGVGFLFNTLVEVDENLNIIPSLAKSWTFSNDQQTITFTIRDDVYFHDNMVFHNGVGRKMTAHDIVFSFERLVDPVTASSGAWIFNDKIRSYKPFEAPNDTTFILHLNKPYAPIISILSMRYCAIVPKEGIDKWGKDFRNHPIGTGPFKFQLWDENNILLLAKNNNYWEKDSNNKPLPYLDGVKVTFNETRVVEFLLFRQGKIDFINGIDGTIKDLILTKNGTLKEEYQEEFNLCKQQYLNTEYLGFLLDTTLDVLKNNPVKQKLVRQAINYAIDKNKIVTFYRNGIGTPAKQGFVPLSLLNNEQHSYGYEYQPQKAIELLKQAGWKNEQTFGSIKLFCPESQVDICNFIVHQLKDVGLNAQVEVMQPGLLRQMMSKSEAPFFKAQWIADYPDAETFLTFFFSDLPAPPNYTRMNNKLFDNWYLESLSITDLEQRNQLYLKMDSLVMNDAALVPLFYDEILHFTRKNIHGMTRNAMNIINIKKVRKE
jgi:oligopeptide transport system substrate-binding protein